MKPASVSTIGKLFRISISVLLFLSVFLGAPGNPMQGVQSPAHALSEVVKETEKTGVEEQTVRAEAKPLEASGKVRAADPKTLKEREETYEAAVQEPKPVPHNAKASPEGPDREEKGGGQGHLFTRKTGVLKALGWKPIEEELSRLSGQVAVLFSASPWAGEIKGIWNSSGFSSFSPVLLLMIILFLAFRLRRHCTVLAERPFWKTHPWAYVGMELFHRSLPLLATVLFLSAGVEAQYGYFTLPLLRVVLYVLVIWLFSGWVYGFLKFWQNREVSCLPQNLASRLFLLVAIARVFGVAYVLVGSMLGSDSMILLLGRLGFEIAFLFWTVSFSRALAVKRAEGSPTESPLLLRIKSLLIGFLYIVASVGFVVELAGYGRLALYWYVSWGRTAVVFLWAALLLFLLHAWHLDFARGALSNEVGSETTARPIKWLLIRLAWVAWLGALAAFLLLSWGARQTVLLSCIQALSRPIQVGSIRFSLVGFVYAFFILLITRTAARFGRHILERRLLVDSGLEAGVQQSVASITVYLLWGVGILIALTALGFSTTSLTVALGALGVGLGFGLQNIFNNFVSGLILLFERPVQVGDAIEVNGTWGTISKIKVRSTVVQTYDNASLIIPNSDMISNQVTNWSFKDLRLRRWITVGVAYGSDTELVRETLLEIARAEPKVLKRPRPDVLFRDFGDSALIFSLRVWTTVDDFIAMETAIRFQIDRLFRERKIEIAFPQRDIHIRSVVEGAQPVAQSGRPSENSQEGGTR